MKAKKFSDESQLMRSYEKSSFACWDLSGTRIKAGKNWHHGKSFNMNILNLEKSRYAKQVKTFPSKHKKAADVMA